MFRCPPKRGNFSALVCDAVAPLVLEEFRDDLRRHIVGGIVRGRRGFGERPVELLPDRLFAFRRVGLAEIQDEAAAVMDRKIDDLQRPYGSEVSAGDE